MTKELSEKRLPKCYECGGKLTKINKTIHSRSYACTKCGKTYKLEKKIGSGYNFK